MKNKVEEARLDEIRYAQLRAGINPTPVNTNQPRCLGCRTRGSASQGPLQLMNGVWVCEPCIRRARTLWRNSEGYDILVETDRKVGKPTPSLGKLRLLTSPSKGRRTR